MTTQSFDEIENHMRKSNCKCGGDLSVKDSIMLCSDCGYGACLVISRYEFNELTGYGDCAGIKNNYGLPVVNELKTVLE